MKKRNLVCTFKKGRLSFEEKANINDWHLTMDVKDMALRLNRPEHQITKYLNEYLAHAPTLVSKRSETEEFRRELHASVFWSDIKKQFTDHQVVFYENSYIEYRRQFKDMTTTELKQLYQLITIDIYISVHNLERKKTVEEIHRIEKLLDKMREKDYSQWTSDDKRFAQHNETMLLDMKMASEKKVGEFADLLKKHEDILKSLKSTRDQRIRSLEGEGKFMAILKELEVASRRKSVGEIMGVMDLAVSKERERLSQSHIYKDGMLDRPLLTPESVIMEDE